MTRSTPLTPLVLLALAGCWGRASAPAEPTALTDDEVAQQTIAFMNEMVVAGTPHLDDCDALAAAMAEVVERHRPLLAITAKYHEDPVKKQWFDEHYGDQARTMGMWMHDHVLPPCGRHPAIQAVISEMR